MSLQMAASWWWTSPCRYCCAKKLEKLSLRYLGPQVLVERWCCALPGRVPMMGECALSLCLFSLEVFSSRHQVVQASWLLPRVGVVGGSP